MNTFVMFGKYTSEAVHKMSPDRTVQGLSLIKKFGGEIQAMYALLGEIDLIFVLTFPNIEQAMKASIALSKMTGISFTTSPAVSVGEFDKLITDV
ncbi:MAG: GYD domain-containing protein [bacterium]|nr:MAG: GYD domain-containing protein [bacterium]